MSMMIKISYTEDVEADVLMRLLSPIIDLFDIKKTEKEDKQPFKYIYLNPVSLRKRKRKVKEKTLQQSEAIVE